MISCPLITLIGSFIMYFIPGFTSLFGIAIRPNTITKLKFVAYCNQYNFVGNRFHSMNSEFSSVITAYRRNIESSLKGDNDSLSTYYQSLPSIPTPRTPVNPVWVTNRSLTSSYARAADGRSHRVVEEWDEEEDNKDNMIVSPEPNLSSIPVSQVDIRKGKLFSIDGPAPYAGDILENEELVWADDIWTPEKEEQALAKLAEQSKTGKQVNEYWRKKYVREAGRFWHFFYQRNEDHFYKDRHYLHAVFPELLTQPISTVSSTVAAGDDSKWYLLEIGSGVGNAVWPLLQLNPVLQVTAMDFAKSAIELLNKRALQPENIDSTTGQPRTWGHIKSIIEPDFQAPLPSNISPASTLTTKFLGYDCALCMFVLSAIAPEDHRRAFTNIYHALRGSKASSSNPTSNPATSNVVTGSRKSYLFIRDYGRYDEAQLRFKGDAKLEENFYVRQDGTCAYFFTIDEIIQLAESIGFHCEEAYYIHRQYANRHTKQARYRVWIHLKFSC